MQTELEFPNLPIRPRRGPPNGNARAADQTIGRAEELRRLQEYADRRQDTLVLGPAGVGKSHLLALVRGHCIVRVRSLTPARQTLLEIAEALFQAGVLRVQPTVVASAAAPRTARPQAPGSRQPAAGEMPALVGAAARAGERAEPALRAGTPSWRSARPPAGGAFQPPVGGTPAVSAAPTPTTRSQRADAVHRPAAEVPALAGAAGRPGGRAAPAPRARTASSRTVCPSAGTGAPRAVRPPAVTPARSDFAAFRKQHTGTTIQGWARLVTQAVPPRQWLLVIDDLAGLTRVQGQLLDQLGERCAILAAVIELPRADRQRFARYKRIPLANLCRPEATALMRQRLAGVRMDNPRLVEAYLWHHSVGNPRALVEMVDQLRREPAITEDAARHLEYPGARPQLDLTPIILIPAVFLVAARFVARGLGDTEAYILAGVGAALVMGLQFLLFRLRR